MFTVTVIIVNWNSGQWLEKCIKHLLNQSICADSILIIDNASSDGSVEYAMQISAVELIHAGSNLGFAAANNLGIARSKSDYIITLNPDAFPEPDWIERLLAAASKYPEIASFGSRQMEYGHTDVLDGTGDVYHTSGVVWRNHHGSKLSPDDLIQREIFAPCAAAAMYKRQALVNVGGFDEDYFCYLEDVDLGFRLRLAGYKSVYVPDAVVQHVGSATTGGQHSAFSVYHGHRNLVWTYIKNMPGILFWILLPMHLILNLVIIVWFSTRGQTQIILAAKYDAIKGIGRYWRKRKQIQHGRIATLSEIWNVLDKRFI